MKTLLTILIFAVAALPQTVSAQTARAADITEIVFEDGDGFCANCDRTFTIRSDGTATVRGGRNSSYLKGEHRGKIGKKRFLKLAKEIVAAGFFDFPARYEGRTSDVATIRITLVRDGKRKTVENFGASEDAKIKSVENAIRTVLRQIKWQKVGD